MCGRIAQFDKEKLAERYNVKAGPSFDATPHWNVAPGQLASVVTAYGLESMKWGMIPRHSGSTPAGGGKQVNAKAETLAQITIFKYTLREHRCIVPANGFYEWAKRPDGRTGKPFYFHPAGDDVFSLAGLYEVRRDADGHEYKTFCIITTQANATVQPVHDRMPAILLREAEELWLDPYVDDPAQILPLLTAFPPSVMVGDPVRALVNKVRNDGPELIRRLEKVA
jgi:putative SOS response-associated peptidase YedK